MNEIQYMEKPDWVPWEQVCDCIHDANSVNDKKGFHMLFSDITPEEIKNKIESKEGKCFVALINDRVVGTTSYKIEKLNKWYAQGKVVYFCYDGIRPEYQGTDVYLELRSLKSRQVKKTGIKIYQFHTAEHNKTVIKLNLKFGSKLVVFRPTEEKANYYSVTMVKWVDGCPFPEWFLKFMFNLSKIVTKTFFNPDYTYKFKFWK